MYSILKASLGMSLLGILAAGCTRVDDYAVARMNPTPIEQDEAMAIRQWDQNKALYSNGTVTAYPTLYPYTGAASNGDYVNLFWDPTLFVGQTLAVPVTACVTPPWKETVYRGVYTPPTFTADVPLCQIP